MTIVTESLHPHQETPVQRTPDTPDEPTPTDDAATPSPTDRLVPVAEAIRYRKRAQVAEQQLTALQHRLDAAQQRCEVAEQTITGLERRQKIDALLAEADAIDLDAARLLTEAAVQAMSEPDVAEAVADLRRHKPYLFHPQTDSLGGLALAPGPDEQDDPMARAAQEAQHSGDRRDLLRYLRLRRRP